jgi:hypothetical protein
MKTLIVAAIIGVVATPAFADCKARDFEFKQFDVVRDPGDSTWVKVIGEIVNHCRTPADVSFRVIYRDASGRVVHVRDFGAGPGGENIQPGDSAAFDANDDVGAPWSTIDGPKISNIVQWPD